MKNIKKLISETMKEGQDIDQFFRIVALYRSSDVSVFKNSPPVFQDQTLPELTEVIKSFDEMTQELTQIRNTLLEAINTEIK